MGRKLLALALLILVAQGLWYYPRMPAVLATHFGGSGRPNGWMTVPVAIGFECFLVGVMLLAFFALPKMLRRIDPSLINLPHRDYWLAPARRTASLDALEGYLNLFGGLVLLFIALIEQLVFRVNLAPPPTLGGWTILGPLLGFLAVTLGWMVMLLRRFRAPG